MSSASSSSATAATSVNDVQSEFFRSQPKNWLFNKRKQKDDCAAAVCMQMTPTALINATVYTIPKSNQIYIDYSIFKSFAHPAIYCDIVDRIVQNFHDCSETYGSFDVHINLASLTVSGIERYREFIDTFITNCLQRNLEYSTKLNRMYLYNVPHILEAVSRMLSRMLDAEVMSKVVIYDKPESRDALEQLFNEKPHHH